MTHYNLDAPESFEIIVGDEKQPVFKPRLKVKRWDNEVNFSIGIVSSHTGNHSNINNNIEWTDGQGLTARFYEINEKKCEFEIELASKPISNTIDLSIQSKGLDFFYQPELTQQEIDDGVTRPENIVNSYAVYHATKSNHKIGEMNYQTGKAFHIFRPHAIDSMGTGTWCNIHINENTNILSILVPQDFIDKAIYPIIIDPTFGWTSQGGTAYNCENIIHLGRFSIPADGNGSNISTWITVSVTARNAKCNIYADEGGASDVSISPFTNGETEEKSISAGADQLISFDFNNAPAFTSGNFYRLAIWTAAASGDCQIFYDSTTGADNWYYDFETYGSWPDPSLPTQLNGFRVSIYCTYTTSETATNLLSGKLKVIEKSSNNLDGKLRLKDVVTGLIDGKLRLKDTVVNILDGNIQIQDIGTNLLDGKVVMQDSHTVQVDGKVRIGDTDTTLLDGKVKVYENVTDLLDGKLRVRDIATNLLDGKVRVEDKVINLVDGKVRIKYFLSNLVDGKVRIKDVTSNLFDGKLRAKDVVTGLADGKVNVKYTAANILDGNIKIKNIVTELVDGLLRIFIPISYIITTSSETQHAMVASVEDIYGITTLFESQHTLTFTDEK